MAAESPNRPDRHRRRAMDVVLVVELGRSTGSVAVAAGLALAQARALQANDGGWVLLAELDPRGGDLMDKLVLGGTPRLNADRETRAGARELVEHLVSVELSVGPAEPEVPALAPYLVRLAGEPGMRVLLGDPLVDGAARATTTLTAPRIRALALKAGAATAIIDGGPWTSAEPDRLDGVDLVYAVVQSRSAAENSRGVAEVAALWRQLRAAERPARLVVVIVDPAWPPDEVRRLYEKHVPAGPSGPTGYRVVALGRRRERRLVAQLSVRSWWTISNRALAPFVTLASPIGDRPSVRSGRPPMPESSASNAGVDEHAYLAASPAADPAWDRREPVLVEPGPLPAVVDRDVDLDPGLWPFSDGAGLADWFGDGVVAGPAKAQPIDRLGLPAVEIGSAPLRGTPDDAVRAAGERGRSPAVVAAMRARWPEPEGNGAAPARPADSADDHNGKEVG